MHDADVQVGAGIDGAGHSVVAVAVDVGVVDAAELDVQGAGLEPAGAVVEVEPTGGGQGGGELFVGEVGDAAVVVVGPAGSPQVAGRVLEDRRIKVVRAEDEHAGALEEGAERLEEGRYGVGVGDRIAGVD